jgi:transcriptional regulator GlxA family with amidase domain
MTKYIRITIIDYPNALQSAVYGLQEMFLLASQIAIENQLNVQFIVKIMKPESDSQTSGQSEVVIIPPSLNGQYYKVPSAELLTYLLREHERGAILCCACAGAFILAKTGILDKRVATTHWKLRDQFSTKYPLITLQIESVLINDGDIISAGGLMSWVDLGLEIVAQFTQPHIMRQLGKYLIVDTGKREQRYYASFTPEFNHGNQPIIQAQHHIQANYNQLLTISRLASIACMSDRTFLRHFSKATALKPIQYIQRVRVQKACELLESTSSSLEQIALSIGYDDVNSFRKIFIKVMGLSPKAFQARFSKIIP